MERRLSIIQLITNFIFVEDKPKKADLIIVPGTSMPQLHKKAVFLYKKGFAKKILFTGNINPRISQKECDFGAEIAIKLGVLPKNILKEGNSTNTKENAVEAAKLIRKFKLPHKRILLVSKPYHARRLKMTFAQVFPHSELLIVPVVDERKITKNNWWKEKEKIAKVMEEVKKIGEYFLKGDLALK
ncbi:MAG: YdcF family protein [Microgenomates group bacterium]